MDDDVFDVAYYEAKIAEYTQILESNPDADRNGFYSKMIDLYGQLLEEELEFNGQN